MLLALFGQNTGDLKQGGVALVYPAILVGRRKNFKRLHSIHGRPPREQYVSGRKSARSSSSGPSPNRNRYSYHPFKKVIGYG